MINSTNIPRAYSEVYAFMNTIGQEYINKVPKRIYEKIRNNRDKSYNPIYNKNQTMTKDSISKEALSLIAGLNLQYWCENEKEKEKLKQCYKANQLKEQEMYSYNNLFKKDETQSEKTQVTALIEYKKDNFFVQLINNIKKWWKRKNN